MLRRAPARMSSEKSARASDNVVRRMFADIDADIYLMAAGDGTTIRPTRPSLINALITEHVDMAIGRRRDARRSFDRRKRCTAGCSATG